jgi:hypothetical protein
MGQYWRVVNLDKCEYIDPYALGSGAKLWEQRHNCNSAKAFYGYCPHDIEKQEN